MVGFLFLEWLYCMHSKRLTYGSNRVFDFLVLWILPVGLLLLLSALFFVGNRNVLHRIVYILFSVPTLFLLCMRPREFKDLLREPCDRVPGVLRLGVDQPALSPTAHREAETAKAHRG